MNFFTPNAAWLALLAVPLVAFYFLKLKRPRQEVPSLVLWRRVMDDQRVNSPFQRFKRHLLLLLQLLLLLLLVLAAMQPFLKTDADRAQRVPVLIDHSASMAALDQAGGKPRLAVAKERVLDLIAGLLPDQEMAILTVSNEARQRLGFTKNKEQLRQAVNAIEVDDVPSLLEPGFRLAEGLARSERFDEVFLFSDGNFPDTAELDLPFRVVYERLPTAGPNIGITACRARRAESATWRLFIEISASALADYGGALEIRRAEASVAEPALASQLVTLAGGKSTRVLLDVSGLDSQTLKIELFPNAPFDALVADNVAYLTLPKLRPLRVEVSSGLSAFRHAVGGDAETIEMLGEGAAGPRDLLITDVASNAAKGALVRCLIGQTPTELADMVRMEERSCQAIDWDRSAALLEHVEFGNVVFMDFPIATEREAGSFLNRGFRVLLEAPQGPLILEEAVEGGVTYHFLFKPSRSTFPYRVGFPVMVMNLVNEASSRAGLSESVAGQTGSLAGLLGMEPEQRYEIVGPDGVPSMEAHSSVEGVLSGIVGTKPGLYRIQRGGEIVQTVSASLLSREETALAGRETLRVGSLEIVASAEPVRAEKPLWRLLALLALVVLLVEWRYFHHRPSTRLRHSA